MRRCCRTCGKRLTPSTSERSGKRNGNGGRKIAATAQPSDDSRRCRHKAGCVPSGGAPERSTRSFWQRRLGVRLPVLRQIRQAGKRARFPASCAPHKPSTGNTTERPRPHRIVVMKFFHRVVGSGRRRRLAGLRSASTMRTGSARPVNASLAEAKARQLGRGATVAVPPRSTKQPVRPGQS